MRTLLAILLLTLFLYTPLLAITTADTAADKTKGQEMIITINCQNEKPYYQVLHYTEFYAKKYNVPAKYLFAVLKTETGYRANDTTYNPFSKRILKTPWVGPYQMLPSTAKSVWKDTLNELTKTKFKKKMQFDLNFSVHTAVKYISLLYKKYKDWRVVFSVYNMGPAGEHHINKYSKRITGGVK